MPLANLLICCKSSKVFQHCRYHTREVLLTIYWLHRVALCLLFIHDDHHCNHNTSHNISYVVQGSGRLLILLQVSSSCLSFRLINSVLWNWTRVSFHWSRRFYNIVSYLTDITWLDNFKLIFNFLHNYLATTATNQQPYIIDQFSTLPQSQKVKQHFQTATWYITNKIVLRRMKLMILKLNLPYMERKWNKL